jgi:hypothetical protein
MLRKLALLFLCAPVVAFANGDTGSVNISNANLQIISYSGQQYAYLYVPVTGGGCTSANAVQLMMDSTNPLGGAMYATLLAAKTTGKAIDIATQGCSSAGIPIIISIYLQS